MGITAFEKQQLSKRLKLNFEDLALNEVAMDKYKAESQMFDRTSADELPADLFA